MLRFRPVGAGLDGADLFLQLDALPLEHLPIGGKVDGAGVGQGLLDGVAEPLVELRDVVAQSAVLPERALVQVLATSLGDAELVVPHQLVVHLLRAPVHVALGQRLARAVVVVDDLDVVVRVATSTVAVGDDEDVAVGVEPLRVLIAKVIDRLDLLRFLGVELGVQEALNQRPGLDLPAMGLGKRFGPGHELLRAVRIAPHGRHAVRALGLVLLVLGRPPCSVQLVVHCRGGLGDALGVGDAHGRLTPPSSDSTALST